MCIYISYLITFPNLYVFDMMDKFVYVDSD